MKLVLEMNLSEDVEEGRNFLPEILGAIDFARSCLAVFPPQSFHRNYHLELSIDDEIVGKVKVED